VPIFISRVIFFEESRSFASCHVRHRSRYGYLNLIGVIGLCTWGSPFGMVCLIETTEYLRIRRATARTALAVVVALILGNPLAAKHKDDLIVMKNGDRFTGEIKRLDHGILYFKSSYMLQSVQLDWTQVDRIESKDSFFVTLQSGKRYVAEVVKIGRKEAAAQIVQLNTEGGALEVAQAEVVSIQQSEGNFWSQLNGSTDYGLSYSSGNSALSSSLGADVNYQRTKDYVALSTSSQFNNQSRGPSTSRYTLDGQYFRSLSPQWFYGGLLDLLKSDQQDLNLRTTTGGAVGRTMLRTDRTSLRIFAGTVFSREKYFPQQSVTPLRQNAEGLLGANFYIFRFRVLDVQSSLLVYPGLTDAGRVRLSSDSDIHIELIKDFYWDFRLYENFDSRPPINAPRNDLGTSTGLGWKF
jgi:putative salt-induced outer membrane protein YdiY